MIKFQAIKATGQKIISKITGSTPKVETQKVIPEVEPKHPIEECFKLINKLAKGTTYAKKQLGVSSGWQADGVFKTLIKFIFKPKECKKDLIAYNKAYTLLNKRLTALKEAGYDLPKYILLQNKIKVAKGYNVSPEIQIAGSMVARMGGIININPFFAKKPFNFAEIVAHEVGHFLHSKKFGSTKDFEQLMTVKLTPEELNVVKPEFKKFYHSVAEVQYNSQNPLEFVAVYFQKAVHGHKFSDEMTAIYNKYKGPEIKGIINPNEHIKLHA